MPSVPVKQKQEEQTQEALLQKTWFANEAKGFAAPASLKKSKQLQLKLSNFALDLRDSLQTKLILELETGLGFNLMPVFMGIGILVYSQFLQNHQCLH